MEGVRCVMKARFYVLLLRTVPSESLIQTAVRLFQFTQILWLISHTAVVVTNPLFAQTGVEKCIAVWSTRIILVHNSLRFCKLIRYRLWCRIITDENSFSDINYTTDSPCHIGFYEPLLNRSFYDVSNRI